MTITWKWLLALSLAFGIEGDEVDVGSFSLRSLLDDARAWSSVEVSLRAVKTNWRRLRLSVLPLTLVEGRQV